VQHSSNNTIIIKSMRIRLVGRVARMERKINTYKYSKNVKGTDHFGSVWVEDGIILKLIMKKCGVRLWTGVSCIKIGSVASSCEHSNELSSSIKSRGFFTVRTRFVCN
jgi:hypothetical protein